MDCLTYDEKKLFLTIINDTYKYDQKTIDYMMHEDVLICRSEPMLITTSNVLKIKLVSLLEKTTKFLQDYHIDYWLDSGTLLGAIRNGKIIPWDDDIDLAVPDGSFTKLSNLMKTFPQEVIKYDKYNVTLYYSEKYGIKLEFGYWAKPENKIKNNLGYVIKVYSIDADDVTNTEFIDLILYYKQGDQLVPNTKPYYFTDRYDISRLYPLKKVKFEGKYYPVPSNPENFLNRSYKFWKHLGVASHSHFKEYKEHRNKKLFFILPSSVSIFNKILDVIKVL